MSSCSLHICSCSSLITFRTDCGKEEKGEKSTQGQSPPDPDLPGERMRRKGSLQRVSVMGRKGWPSPWPGPSLINKNHVIFPPESCSILGPVLKFDIYFLLYWMAILLSQQPRHRGVWQIPSSKQQQQQRQMTQSPGAQAHSLHTYSHATLANTHPHIQS